VTGSTHDAAPAPGAFDGKETEERATTGSPERVVLDARGRVMAPLAVSGQSLAVSLVAVALDGRLLLHAPRTLKLLRARQKAHARMDGTSG
jgi:hypothetical protein